MKNDEICGEESSSAIYMHSEHSDPMEVASMYYRYINADNNECNDVETFRHFMAVLCAMSIADKNCGMKLCRSITEL